MNRPPISPAGNREGLCKYSSAAQKGGAHDCQIAKSDYLTWPPVLAKIFSSKEREAAQHIATCTHLELSSTELSFVDSDSLEDAH